MLLYQVGSMYTGNDLNISYWYINRWFTSSLDGSAIYKSGNGGGYILATAWYAARPIITLLEKTLVKSGNGTVVDPYVLSM